MVILAHLLLLEMTGAPGSRQSPQAVANVHPSPDAQQLTTAAAHQEPPLILIYNPLYNSRVWYSHWINVRPSNVVQTLENC